MNDGVYGESTEQNKYMTNNVLELYWSEGKFREKKCNHFLFLIHFIISSLN